MQPDNGHKEKNELLKIKLLETQYETVLGQYEEAHQNYIQYMDNTSTSTPVEFSELKRRTFWGTAGLEQGTANSAAECEDMCIRDPKCSGATFNSDKHYCWTRSGTAPMPITAGKSSDIALIPKEQELLIQLKFYNQRLMKINSQISELYANYQASDSTEQQEKEQQDKHALLADYSSKLQEENDALDVETQRIETINVTKNTQEATATQGYTQFRFWMLIACILLLVSMKLALTAASDGSGNGGSIGIMVPIIILVFLAASFMLQTPQGFMVFGLMVFGIILFKVLS